MSDFELLASTNVGRYSHSSMKLLKHGLIPSNHDFNQSIILSVIPFMSSLCTADFWFIYTMPGSPLSGRLIPVNHGCNQSSRHSARVIG